jgi:hypothetical protein
MSAHSFLPHVVYIGLQKTGSTYLRGYLYNHPEVSCTRHGAFFQKTQSEVTDAKAEMAREQYGKLFSCDPHKPCRVDMYESIGMGYFLASPNNWTAEYFLKGDQEFQREQVFVDQRCIAARIKAILPEAKILLTIRNQRAWFDSNYRHFLDYMPRGRDSLSHFLRTTEGKLMADAAMFDRTVQAYDELFGPDRVMVLPVELIERDENAAIESLCQFLQIRQLPYLEEHKTYNKGRTLDSLLAARASDRRGRSSVVTRLARLWNQGEIALSTENHLGLISNIYAASNARLSERIGYNLKSLGYTC